MDDLKIVLKETTSVKPSKYDHDQIKTFELSGLDRISPANLNSVFFYRPNDYSVTNIFDGVVERVKRALERVLVSWFPAAGRLQINSETGKLKIDCNDEGVTVVTAEACSRLDELGELRDYKACYEKLVPKIPDHGGNMSDNPLFVVQITKFACGGISLGVGGSHALFDGFGAFNFLRCWANFSREKDEITGHDDHGLIIPNHSRERLLKLAINTVDGTSASSSIHEQDHIAAIQDLYAMPVQAMASDDRRWESELAKFGRSERQGLVRLVTLSMKKEIVETWKQLGVQSFKLSKCSTFDVLCAHVWKARVKALSLEPDTKICLQFPVDSRSRLRPSLGPGFTGNAFVLASVSTTTKALTAEPLYATVAKIQAAKDTVSDEYVKLYVRALDSSSDKFLPSMKELTIITDWLKFPFEDLDFGLGQFCGLSLLGTPVPEAAFILPNFEEYSGDFMVRIGIGEQYVSDFITNFNNFDYP